MEQEEITGQEEQEAPGQATENDMAEDGEQLSDVVEGFEQDDEEPAEEDSAEASTGEEKPVEERTPAEDEPKKEEPSEVRTLKAEVRSIGYALREAQKELQKYKQKPESEGQEEALTPDQIKQLMAEYKDDPATMYNIMEYVGKQAAKQTNKETVSAQRVSEIKNKADAYVARAFPELLDDTSPARVKVNEIKGAFQLSDHPAGDYFAASAFIADNLDTIKKQAYEQGRQDGQKGKAEEARKKNVEDTTLVSSKKSGPKKTGALPSNYAQTFKQMGLSPSAQKIAQSLIAKKDNTQAEA